MRVNNKDVIPRDASLATKADVLDKLELVMSQMPNQWETCKLKDGWIKGERIISVNFSTKADPFIIKSM